MSSAGFGLLAKIGSAVAKAAIQFAHRTGDRLEAEKSDLRKDLVDLLRLLETASTKAQISVNASSNSPVADEAHAAAIENATQACQRVANLFRVGPGAVPSDAFKRARLAFREATTDEDNPSIMDTAARLTQCERIEAACADFHNELCDEAFRRYGQGIGPRSGILKGRKIRR